MQKLRTPSSLQSALYLLPDGCLDVAEDVGREVRGEARVGALQGPDQGADPGYNIVVSIRTCCYYFVNIDLVGPEYYEGII